MDMADLSIDPAGEWEERPNFGRWGSLLFLCVLLGTVTDTIIQDIPL